MEIAASGNAKWIVCLKVKQAKIVLASAMQMANSVCTRVSQGTALYRYSIFASPIKVAQPKAI